MNYKSLMSNVYTCGSSSFSFHFQNSHFTSSSSSSSEYIYLHNIHCILCYMPLASIFTIYLIKQKMFLHYALQWVLSVSLVGPFRKVMNSCLGCDTIFDNFDYELISLSLSFIYSSLAMFVCFNNSQLIQGLIYPILHHKMLFKMCKLLYNCKDVEQFLYTGTRVFYVREHSQPSKALYKI